MKRFYFLLLTSYFILTLTACNNFDDFAIEGKVIDHEMCTSVMDMGYAVQLDEPDSVGGTYLASDNKVYRNVVVVYKADQIVKRGERITGRIYLDPNHSKAYCNYNYRNATGEVPEACFTQLRVVDDK